MTPTDFVRACEQRLGWENPTDHLPSWKRYQSTVKRVRARMAEDPSLYTVHNLMLAVALLEKEKKPRTPLGVFAHVQRALDLALDHEPDVEAQIREAIAYETRLGDPSGWVGRLVRAQGAYRAEVLQDWREAVR